MVAYHDMHGKAHGAEDNEKVAFGYASEAARHGQKIKSDYAKANANPHDGPYPLAKEKAEDRNDYNV